eukprot:TRINITY_DN54207_c0_g1_i1.p1 TRINITY_DN54207_c0_g1~~TRINITY_DN54207_c0_g1_i1.p1  ORF type:complete len:307 (+),score=75.25 TRINITY_DN54207_c0_g1_i1:63-983(+)
MQDASTERSDDDSGQRLPELSFERPAYFGGSHALGHGRLPDPVMQDGWTSAHIENALGDMLQKRASAYGALQSEVECRVLSAAAAEERAQQAELEIEGLRRKVAMCRHFEGLCKAVQEENRLLWTYMDSAQTENARLKETIRKLDEENEQLRETAAILKAKEEERKGDRELRRADNRRRTHDASGDRTLRREESRRRTHDASGRENSVPQQPQQQPQQQQPITPRRPVSAPRRTQSGREKSMPKQQQQQQPITPRQPVSAPRRPQSAQGARPRRLQSTRDSVLHSKLLRPPGHPGQTVADLNAVVS